MNTALRSAPFLLACCFLTATAAQNTSNVEYGTVDDLKGVTRIYVDTGLDLENRERIIKEIEKQRKKAPDLRIVSTLDEAEVVLTFGADGYNELYAVEAKASGNTVRAEPKEGWVDTGKGLVFKKAEGGRRRLLMSYTGESRYRFTKSPATKFAKKFMDMYVRANR